MKQRIYATITASTPGDEYVVHVAVRKPGLAEAACHDYSHVMRSIASIMPNHDDLADIAHEIAMQPGVYEVHVVERGVEPYFGITIVNQETE